MKQKEQPYAKSSEQK